MKNAEATISSWRGSKKFEDWGRLKNFRTGGGGGVPILRSYFCWGESVPHYMPCIFDRVVNKFVVPGIILSLHGSFGNQGQKKFFPLTQIRNFL